MMKFLFALIGSVSAVTLKVTKTLEAEAFCNDELAKVPQDFLISIWINVIFKQRFLKHVCMKLGSPIIVFVILSIGDARWWFSSH